MKHRIFKKALLFALTLLFIEIASGQSKEKAQPKDSKITIDLKNIEFGLNEAFRAVAFELKNIDFEKIGTAIEIASREIGNIEVEVIDADSEEEHEYVGTAEKTKRIIKTYVVNKDDKLAINNQYGKVAVHVWAKNEIKVEVEIKAFEASENSATELLESVNIAESHNGNLISFKTNFEKTSLNFWSRIKNGKEERRGVQVNYIIYMPAKNALDINNRYGSTEIDDFSGPVNISSSYGSFSSGKLDHPANQVKVNYGSASIENFSNGNLTISYGSLKLTEGDKLNATIRYSSSKIAHLSNGGTFNVAYSSGFKIDEVDKNVKNLNITSSYSGVTLGIDETADFDFDVTVSYAGFNYSGNRVSVADQLSDSNSSKGWNPTKNFKGQVGKGSDSRIIIKSNYGGVKFL
ncbi:hypothetical protein SAMN05421813_10749 [Daejeonella rubra]|uniref:Adhesin n=1 Tax=Daejeonella rubra TaxID=990371 RepID=A0A1G9R1E7_9SPHI|nr:hypothetical protein [Daejeonella rubra]SDM17068.1 hypothetical protein SAMN05421813_10749 [Daejeonella rubra]